MALEGFLPAGYRYLPCDLVRRDNRIIVCDLNTGCYPDAQAKEADLITVLGVLEYIFDPRAFLLHLWQWQHPVVMSYCSTDAIGTGERLNIGSEILDNMPLDSTIQKIQRYATVFSELLHPLLCALTSADKVGYRE